MFRKLIPTRRPALAFFASFTLASSALVAATLTWAASGNTGSANKAPAAAIGDLPSEQFLAEQGLTVVGPMPAVGGLKAWAAYRDQQPIPIYRLPDGKHWVIGTVIDAQGKDVNAKTLQSAVQKPMGNQAWTDLERTHWIADGKPDAPVIAYVFTDPNCPYCNQLWREARPWVQSGQLQLRHVLVGILRPSSEGKAAAILSAQSPAQALASHAQAYAEAQGKSPDTLGIAPLARIPLSARDALTNNLSLMTSMGIRATPATIWKNASGTVQTRTGMPPGLMTELLGSPANKK